MAQDKLPERAQSGAGPNASSGVHESEASSASTYEACMRVYRWMSKRYRKTLDALAK